VAWNNEGAGKGMEGVEMPWMGDGWRAGWDTMCNMDESWDR